jgi:hypothetical protein
MSRGLRILACITMDERDFFQIETMEEDWVSEV